MKRTVTLLFAIAISVSAMAQTAIRGKLIDDETGEPMLFANVGIKGTTIGGISDFDGNFSIESPSLKTGTCDVQVSFVSYQTKIIEGVKVTEGKVTLLGEIRMKSEGEQLQEVVVSAEAIKSSETAMLTMKKKSAAMLDGISSEEMKLIGDGTASEAAKRVTGVTVEGGKYVYVRGLGDRYTKTTLNGVDIPGLDPDRNTLQMDIFPSNLIDNITISKNFTADQPADFTGGLLNVEIKDLPESKIFNVSAKVGFNPQMHLNPDYLNYNGGSTDYLGLDDGTRDLPASARNKTVPTPISGNSPTEVNSFIKSFNPTLGAQRTTSLMDFDFGISFGNQIRLKEAVSEGETANDPRLGYIFSLSYKSDFTYYDDVTYGEYQRKIDPGVNELVQSNLQTGQLGERSYLIGLLGGISYKTNLSKYRFTVMRLQNAESRAGQFDLFNNAEAVGQSGYIAISDNLEFNQRSLTNALINGKHVMPEKNWEIDWRLSPTFSTSEDPDIRRTAWTINTNNDTVFQAGAGGNPSRIWRNLSEVNLTGKVDFTKKYALGEEQAKLKFGFSHTYKFRDYEILFFDMQFFGRQPNWSSSNPNQILIDQNIFPDGTIYYQTGNNDPNPNEYQSDVNNTGLYVSNEWKLFPRFNTILGLRVENYVQRHTGRDIAYANGDVVAGRNLENDEVLNSLDLFPSVNTIFNLTEEQNLRFAYSRTIARPSFKELSFAQIVDPLTNRIFNGSLFTYSDWDGKLTETRIDNLDLRWEYFFKGDQMVSFSTFYKSFDKPIELVRIPEQQTSQEYQARNVGDGQLIGLEFELRKDFSFISESFRNLKFSGNFTWIRSQIDMSDREFNSRKQYERDGQTVKNTRDMAGQAPYVINGGFIYGNPALALDAGIFYNVKGPTLHIVGVGLYPDVYTEPFHSLNLSLSKRFGEEKRTQVEFNVSNILNDRIESFFTSYETEKEVFSSINPGPSISLGVNHKF
ncbi:MAG: TonB-dependent receptor [Vicingaceae bacterium]